MIEEDPYLLSPTTDLDANTKALNRLAQAVEQLTLTIMDKSLPANLQAIQGPLAQLPPVQPRTSAPVVAATGCSTHGQPWKWVPPGTSKKTGRPYDGFYACPTAGCDQRPPR